MLRVVHVDPDHADARRVVAQLDAALAAITGDSGAASFDPQDCRGALACFVLAYAADGSAVGCGAVRALAGDIGELKRMYARPGSGAGAYLLAALEQYAAACGYRHLWLSTRRVNARAVAFYERHGYAPVAPYGRYVGRAASICLGRRLP
jgi:ribosomal protein S18 acetylase RimI-like enzyme